MSATASPKVDGAVDRGHYLERLVSEIRGYVPQLVSPPMPKRTYNDAGKLIDAVHHPLAGTHYIITSAGLARTKLLGIFPPQVLGHASICSLDEMTKKQLIPLLEGLIEKGKQEEAKFQR